MISLIRIPFRVKIYLLSIPTHSIVTTLPALPSRIVRSIHMLLHLCRFQPRAPILFKRLNPRLELGLLQREIINRADARDAHVGIARAATIHERPAHAAETVLHKVPGCNGAVLAKTAEFVFAPYVFEVGVFDDKVGSEHAVSNGREVLTAKFT